MRNELSGIQSKFILGLIALCFLVYGCAQPLHIKDRAYLFQNKENKLPIKTGVYLTNNARDYVVYGRFGATKVLIGEALEKATVISLGEVFNEVSLILGKDDIPQYIERIVTIEFDAGTKSEVNFASDDYDETSCTTELIYKVYDKKWTLLWEGKSVGHDTQQFAKFKRSFLGGAAGGYQAGMHSIPELMDTVRKSLIAALEKINDQILASGKDVILKGK